MITLLKKTYTVSMTEEEARAVFHGLQTIRLFDNDPELTLEELTDSERQVIRLFMNTLRPEVG